MRKLISVLTFGSFDPLHDGHRSLFSQARKLSDELLVIVATDNVIEQTKGRPVHLPQAERLALVQAEPLVTHAQLGEDKAESYKLLRKLVFDILVVGYDQQPDDTTIRQILTEAGKSQLPIIRLKPHQPDTFKSSRIRR